MDSNDTPPGEAWTHIARASTMPAGSGSRRPASVQPDQSAYSSFYAPANSQPRRPHSAASASLTNVSALTSEHSSDDERDPFWWQSARLYSSKFTDMTLLVGPSEEAYEVHRLILTTQSSFFRVACENQNFREAREQKIKLPTLKPSTIRIILYYLYSTTLKLPGPMLSDAGIDATLDVLESAHYLGIESLIQEITRASMAEANWDYTLEVVEGYRLAVLNKVYELDGGVGREEVEDFIRSHCKRGYIGCFVQAAEGLEECNGRLFRDLMVAVYKNMV